MRRSGPILFAIVSSCGESASGPDPLAMKALVDQNPDPVIVEVSLVAGPAEAEYLPGKIADVWAYRDGSVEGSAGTVPGPVLDVNQGDQVVVHFQNDLPEDTTIHWHGLRVPNAADGTPASQVPVPPGGSFDYQFVAEDAGTFWYHPHVRGDVQIEKGLYAAVVVHAPVEPEVAADRVFILDDVKLEATGELSTETDALDLMVGRQGNVLLVNGQAGATLQAHSKSRERWRFIDSANGRYFNLVLPGHPFRVISSDGGLIVEPYATDLLLVAPGERYDVIVEFPDDAGTTIPLETMFYDRGHNLQDPGPLELLSVEVVARTGPRLAALPTSWGSIEPLPVTATTPVRSLVLSEQSAGLPEPRFYINGEVFPDVTPLNAAEGEVEIWAIQNDSEMDHPFHLHGMFFQVIDIDGVPAERLAWKDTVNIPGLKTLRYAVRYGTPGRWMYHCHILEHAERGMMGELAVSPRL